MNSCSVHCSCCRDWGEQGSKELLAAVVLAVLGFAERKAIDAAEPEDLKDVARDSELAPGTVLAGCGVESRDVAGGGG